MANSGTLPFTIYNMIISMGMRYCLWVYDWLLESILGSYSAFLLTGSLLALQLSLNTLEYVPRFFDH